MNGKTLAIRTPVVFQGDAFLLQIRMEHAMFKSALALCVCLMVVCIAPGVCDPAEDVFTISTSYKSLLSNPEQTGMLDKLTKEAFRRIGLRVEIVFTPTERSLVDVNAGLLDGELNRIEGMERGFPNLVRVPESNMTMHFVAFAKKAYPLNGWKSLEPFHVGIVRGWKILEKETRGFPHVILVPTETELFTMLFKDRIDVALYDKLTGYEQLKLRGFVGIRHLEPPLASREMFLYLHKKHEGMVDAVAKALRQMKQDGTYDRIVRETTSRVMMDKP
ncbi:MAG: transporter substrate-binding domain-containing protein [Deltaproteobacteria bacterium]|nr:transporter substrate-binding domain-containing protein [Deltaproteobacteria bacterium]